MGNVQYVGELYGDIRGERPELEELEMGSDILKSELEWALRKMK